MINYVNEVVTFSNGVVYKSVYRLDLKQKEIGESMEKISKIFRAYGTIFDRQYISKIQQVCKVTKTEILVITKRTGLFSRQYIIYLSGTESFVLAVLEVLSEKFP